MEKLLTTDNLKNISLAALLLFILYAGSSGWWVYSKDYEAMKVNLEKQLTTALAEREEWRQLAISGLQTAQSVSSARIPIMSSGPQDQLSPAEVADQLKVIKNMNDESGEATIE